MSSTHTPSLNQKAKTGNRASVTSSSLSPWQRDINKEQGSWRRHSCTWWFTHIVTVWSMCSSFLLLTLSLCKHVYPSPTEKHWSLSRHLCYAAQVLMTKSRMCASGSVLPPLSSFPVVKPQSRSRFIVSLMSTSAVELNDGGFKPKCTASTSGLE